MKKVKWRRVKGSIKTQCKLIRVVNGERQKRKDRRKGQHNVGKRTKRKRKERTEK